jgi:hypothetical protein
VTAGSSADAGADSRGKGPGTQGSAGGIRAVSERLPSETETVSKTYDIFSFQAPERKGASSEAGIGAGTGAGIGAGLGTGTGVELGAAKSYRPPPDSEKTSKTINDRKLKMRKISADKGKGEYHRSADVLWVGNAISVLCDTPALLIRPHLSVC